MGGQDLGGRDLGELGQRPPLIPHLSPEARRQQALQSQRSGMSLRQRHAGPGTRLHRIYTRVWCGAWNDGMIHAGNLAYTTIVALFPFFITVTAIFSAIGEQRQREASIDALLQAVPPVVARALAPVAHDVVAARSGWLLWLGGLVGLWTVGSLIETIRDILHRAYGAATVETFWQHRLRSTGIIVLAVVALLFSLLAQVALGAVEQAVHAWYPRADALISEIAVGRIVPAGLLFLSLYALFYSLTPAPFRSRAYPKWPGALFVTLWWVAVTMALPLALRTLFNYDLTYGSMAGVMIALFFFWLIGLGMVIGAELNAALAETPEERDMPEERDIIGQTDNRARHNPAAKGGELRE
ncbi:MAG: YihY/virulence factor BrkB family protein [Novosphingobium sp.]